MSVFTDEKSVRDAYADVRDEGTSTAWVVCKYNGKKIEVSATGSEYDTLLSHMGVDERAYAYVGYDCDSKFKYAFITWIGPSVSPLKKAKVSTDKAFVKGIWSQFGKEILADEKNEVQFDRVKKILEAASGAAYGTGK